MRLNWNNKKKLFVFFPWHPPCQHHWTAETIQVSDDGGYPLPTFLRTFCRNHAKSSFILLSSIESIPSLIFLTLHHCKQILYIVLLGFFWIFFSIASISSCHIKKILCYYWSIRGLLFSLWVKIDPGLKNSSSSDSPAHTSDQGNVIGSVRIYMCVYKKNVIERTRDLIYLKFVATDFFPKIISLSTGENSSDLA